MTDLHLVCVIDANAFKFSGIVEINLFWGIVPNNSKSIGMDDRCTALCQDEQVLLTLAAKSRGLAPDNFFQNYCYELPLLFFAQEPDIQDAKKAGLNILSDISATRLSR
jgi:hypothetical protein